MYKKLGDQTVKFENPPVIQAWSSTAGKKEAEGPLGKLYDTTIKDAYAGEKTWEQAEKKMQQIGADGELEDYEQRRT